MKIKKIPRWIIVGMIHMDYWAICRIVLGIITIHRKIPPSPNLESAIELKQFIIYLLTYICICSRVQMMKNARVTNWLISFHQNVCHHENTNWHNQNEKKIYQTAHILHTTQHISTQIITFDLWFLGNRNRKTQVQKTREKKINIITETKKK